MNSKPSPPSLPLPPSTARRKNARYPLKTCKYAGVTFRASRDKFQARIYKGNKEYNLGLFDVSADAALAYDVAHRLVKKISLAVGKEREALDAHEARRASSAESGDGRPSDWLDCGEDADANAGLDPDKLNFLRPLDFKAEREKELNESKLAGTSKHENCPKLDELRVLVHKEAIRVAKIIVGAIDGGTNNYRRKGKKQDAALGDGALTDGTLKNPTKKRRKSSKSTSPDNGNGNNPSRRASDAGAVTSAWVGRDAAAEVYYQATGLGRPVPNPSQSKNKKDHPFGPPSIVPAGHMARSNPQIMQGLAGRSTLKAMLDRGDRSPRQGRHDASDRDGSETKASLGAAAADGGSLPGGGGGGFAGMPGYYAVPGGPRPGPGADGGPDDRGPAGSPENYREFFKKMRNFIPPGPMGGPGQGNPPEEFQRMMIARAMGQGGGTHGNGMAGMMGMGDHSSLNKDFFANGFGDQKKDSKKMESFKSMMQGGMDRSVMPPGMDRAGPGGLRPGRMSPAALNMLRAAGGFPPGPSQGNGPGPYRGGAHPTREPLAGMYGGPGDRFAEQLRALQTAQFGLNPAGFGQFAAAGGGGGGGRRGSGAADQQAFLQSFAGGPAGGFPPGPNVPGGFDNVAHQFFSMPGGAGRRPSSRSQGGDSSDGK